MRNKICKKILFLMFFTALFLFAADDIRADEDYIIGAEDVIHISVWKNSELTMMVTVRPDGKISYPLLDDIQAAGLTPLQLGDKITKGLKDYISPP